MLKFVKALHVLGLAVFFGSILGHVTAGFVPAAQDDPQTALVVRQGIDVATTWLTLPGLVLLLVTGVAMIVLGRLPVLRTRWLALHAVIGLLIVLNGVFVLYPTGQDLLAATTQVAAGALPMEGLAAGKAREAAFGATNVALSLVMVFIAVFKPAFGRNKA